MAQHATVSSWELIAPRWLQMSKDIQVILSCEVFYEHCMNPHLSLPSSPQDLFSPLSLSVCPSLLSHAADVYTYKHAHPLVLTQKLDGFLSLAKSVSLAKTHIPTHSAMHIYKHTHAHNLSSSR